MNLKKADVKYNADEVIFVIHDKTGKLIWLEEGNDGAGLKHILKHASDFERKHGVKKGKLVDHIKSVIEYGKLEYWDVVHKNSKAGYERLYSYENKHYLLAAVGLNGFLVSAHPLSKNRAKKMMQGVQR